MSQEDKIAYAFLSDNFKKLGRLKFLRKGTPLPACETRRFNAGLDNVSAGARACGESDLQAWFDGDARVKLDEEILGLGRYGYTLTVLSSEDLADDPEYEDDDEEDLERSWTPKFAYGR